MRDSFRGINTVELIEAAAESIEWQPLVSPANLKKINSAIVLLQTAINASYEDYCNTAVEEEETVKSVTINTLKALVKTLEGL